MFNAYMNWPKQIREAINSWDKYFIRGDFDEVLVVGMGGSGIVGDYLQFLSSIYGGIPIYVSKSYILPRFIDANTLVMAISYSGNTIETLLALEKAVAKGVTVVTVSSGGLLGEKAAKEGVLHISVPSGLPPRVSLPAMLYSILGLLDTSGYTIVTKKEAYSSMVFLESALDSSKKVAEDLATWFYKDVLLRGKLPVIAVHSPLEPLAMRAKNEFNENSKVVVKVDIAPEWMHNDIVGYENPVPRSFGVVEILDPVNSVGVNLIEFMRKLYSKHDAVFCRLELQGDNFLEKLMYGSLVSGLASVILANLRGIDPAATPSISLYKKASQEIYKQINPQL